MEITPAFWRCGRPAIDDNVLNIVLLAHVQEPRGRLNNQQIQCSKTERFSVEEFYEIYQGIVNAGYYIKLIYYNERDFVEDYLRYPDKFENCLVYNLARNGVGDNKKTVIPAFCELVGLNYSCSPSLSSALCRNKYYFSTLLDFHGIPSPKSWLLTDEGAWMYNSPPDGINVICKPCAESASQGINENSILPASAERFRKFKGGKYVIQEYIDGEECEVPVFKIGTTIEVLPPIGINLGKNKIIDEQTSEEYGYSFYDLSETQSNLTIKKIKEHAQKAFQLLGMEVYGRIDFRIDSSGNPYIFDVSTTPYTIRHSSFAYAFELLGYHYSDIYQAIISAALRKPRAVIHNDKN